MNETTKEIGVIALVSFGVCLAYDLGKKLGRYAKDKISEGKEDK